MSYKALYRVWRPQELQDVVGQEHITKTLQNALGQEKFSHAYLFSGPRGTGKTSAAKILAKAINCEQAPIREPCNACAACQGIADGSVVDIIEIDAASNNGVDEIRYIRDNVIAAPRDIRYKVYIIDEVHMLSTGAFNALLKTLEEPPKHAVFILATTEPHKIPLTIISRCQRFDFKRITAQDIVARMEYIIQEQGWEAEADAMYLIARAAEGGMRDALSLLDQAVSFSESVITSDDVLAITGTVSQQFLTKVIRALKNNDTPAAVEAADRLIQDGKDPLQFMEDMIYYFRDMLLYKTAPRLDEIMERVTVDESFEELSENTDTSWLYDVIHRLNQYHQEMKWASHPKIFLEMALINVCHEKDNTPVEAAGEVSEEVPRLKDKVDQLEQKLKTLEQVPPSPPPSAPAVETNKAAREQTAKNISVGLGGDGKVKEVLTQATKQELQLVGNQWSHVMKEVKQQSVPAHAWLSDAKPVVSDGETVLLAFQNEMHRNMVDTKFRSLIQESLESSVGKPLDVVTILAGQWEKLKEEFKKKQQGSEEDSSEKEEENDPVVDEAVKLVGSELVEFEE